MFLLRTCKSFHSIRKTKYGSLNIGSTLSTSSSFSLTAAATSDSNNDINGKVTEGKTGWNHKPPSESSPFWKEEETLTESRQEKTTTKKLRTGWLHNTEAVNKNKTTKKSATTIGGVSKAQLRLQQAMKEQRDNHRIISPGALHACGEDRQIVVTEHRLSVPVDHVNEGKESKNRIDVAFTIVEEIKDEASRRWFESTFAIMTPSQRAIAYVKRCAMTSAEDMFIYLQGGPGFGAPTPVVGLDFAAKGSSWGSAALDRYQRVVLMDQRGTGSSTPITKQSLEQRFPDLFMLDDVDIGSDQADGNAKKDQADIMDHIQKSYPQEFGKFSKSRDDATKFMSQFRADNIVRDAEIVREVLMLPPSIDDDDKNSNDVDTASLPRPWGGSLGQSFGGFCTMTYLSMIKYPPKVSLLTGGIAPMLANSAVDVYTSLWNKIRERNLRYYDMYPGDISLVKKIVRKLLEAEKDGTPIRLPSGGKLTARRFLQLGMMLGGGPSSFASIHKLLSSAFLQSTTGGEVHEEFTRGFLKTVDNEQSFDESPLYFLLHESIYADGNRATKWSANTAYETKVYSRSGEETEYDYKLTSQEDNNQPVLFFGEMIFPWMTEDYKELGGIGLTELSHALAKKDDWGPLYDADHMRAVLDDGRTRSAAAIYYDDLYVDFDNCMKVTSRNGPLEKCKVYITNEYQHSGLRDDGAAIFSKLHGMATGSIRTPS
ncbi:MAG: hypothetical protein ACI8RD_002303 [Bacillariaceae sp.]|jgi:hypothetical protein